jgi:DNA repair exonuclease SbcCD ATPase subunit
MGKVRLKKTIPSVAYCGSLIQQGYGESINKGYNLWTIDKQDVSHVRRYISNDYGWYKMTISRGESIEDRIDNIKFSSNKKKTRVYIVYEDFEENYSIEKLNQIKQLVKDKYGCEIVHVEFREMDKEVLASSEEDHDEMDPEDVEKMLNMFLDNNEFDLADDQERKEFMDFAMKLEKEIDIKKSSRANRRYTLLTTEISNVFSFPIEPTVIHWDKLKGITGVFGENFCGKSNLLKAVVWGMFQHIMGGAHAKYLVNIYTTSEKGYVKNTYDIDGVKYRTTREVQKGKSSNSYPTKFEVYRETRNEDGEMEFEWCNTLSDNSTADNTEVKNMINDALGTYDDFTKVSIHAQNEKDGYLSLEQQEKNDLIARYLNLQSYRERHEYVKKPFNELRAKQKLLGESIDIELEIKELQNQITEKEKNLSILEDEKRKWTQKQEEAQTKIIELTRSLHKIEDIGYASKEDIVNAISMKRASVNSMKSVVDALESFIEANPMKVLDIDPKRTDAVIESDLKKIRDAYSSEKTSYADLKQWLASNPEHNVPNIDIKEASARIESLNKELVEHQNQKAVFLGKNCPTCKQPIQKADPAGVSRMDRLIEQVESTIQECRHSMDVHSKAIEHNNEVARKKGLLATVEATLVSRKQTIDGLKLEIENFRKNKEFIETNKTIESKKSELKKLVAPLDAEQKLLVKLEEKESLFDTMLLLKKENAKTESDISSIQDLVNTYKVSIHKQQIQITSVTADIRVLNSNTSDRLKKLDEIKSGDKKYKFYSIYLQAVERGGIPAMVIRTKLPLVNNKVNSILQTVVNFKMDFSIDMKGNVTELFYNSVNKWDSLPLASGSGSQSFIIGIAIKDALNYISKNSIVQPSIIMIDEGFGTLGQELRENIMIMLEYLKTKYQNVIIITHLDEVKDGADHVIEVLRDRDIIAESLREKDEKAGITRLYVRR